jgi:predicted O-methyltransferase YrrM
VADLFEDAWTLAESIPGWLTRAQGQALWDAAASVPAHGVIAEIGSHQGRSTVVLARQAINADARVIAIDPFVAGAVFGGAATRGRFERNIRDAGVEPAVRLITERSTALRPAWTESLAMLYVDGKHDYWTARDDLRWAVHLPPGAPVLVHDAFSSIGVTAAVLVHVLPGDTLRYVGRTGSLAAFRVGQPTRRDRARIVGELPWFVRNVVIKVGLRLLRPFGFRRADPY